MNEYEYFTWGSYQYNSTAKIFHDLCELEKEHTWRIVAERFQCDVSYRKEQYGVYHTFVQELRSDIKESYSDGDGDEVIKKFQELLITHSESTISSCMQICRASSWDLWSAAPKLAHMCFPKLEREAYALDKLEESKFISKELKDLMENDEGVGLCCWLLHSLMQVPEEDFMGFDT